MVDFTVRLALVVWRVGQIFSLSILRLNDGYPDNRLRAGNLNREKVGAERQVQVVTQKRFVKNVPDRARSFSHSLRPNWTLPTHPLYASDPPTQSAPLAESWTLANTRAQPKPLPAAKLPTFHEGILRLMVDCLWLSS